MSEKGKIKKYFSDEGYGFIECKGKKDIFFHISDVVNEEDSITEGKEVEFVIGKGKDGRDAAKKVKILSFEDMISIKLPQDTRELITPNLKVVDNFSLKLQKCVEFKYDRKDNKEKAKIEPNYNFKFDEKLINQINYRIQTRMGILEQDLIVNNFEARVDWRLVVGFGSGSVYETSMTLHHVYGIPYIPGSAVKGVVRSFIITEAFGYNNGELNLKDAEERALKDEMFCDIFGCPEQSFYKEARAGKITFMDAFPTSSLTIKSDVMTPHYSKYYSDPSSKTAPADHLNPEPHIFLTVEDTLFRFYLLTKKKCERVFNIGLGGHTILEWLKKALSEHGIGAKTAVGYGYFEVC